MRNVLLGLIPCAVLSLGAAVMLEADTQTTARGLLLVANKGDQTLSIVDPESGKQLAAVLVGGVTGHEVAASPDGQTAVVPIYGNSGVGLPGTDGRAISFIDLKSRAKIASIDLGVPSRPHCAVFNPKNGYLYVSSELTNSIKVIDPATHYIVSSIPTGASESHMFVISHDGARAYTSNVGPGTISAIDLKAHKVLAVIPVAKTIQRIAISSDDRWVFTADQTKPQLAVIDTQTNAVKAWVPLSATGYGMTPTHDGSRLLIAHPSSGSVSILNLQTMKVEHLVHVPGDPQEIVIDPNDRVAYVSCDQSKQVAAIDLSEAKVTKLIDVGAGADGLAWASAH